MSHFLGVALGFPMVIFTVLLGFSLLYWLSVLIGFAHVSMDGADGALDGAADGLDVGGGHDVDVGGHDLGHDAGGHDAGGHDAGDGDVGDADVGHAGMLSALKLRSAPVTIVASCVIFFSWFLGMFGVSALESLHLDGIAPRFALMVLAPAIALFPTSLVIRPLARTLKPVQATKRKELVGKLCTIRTGTVTERFGEAMLEDGGAGLVVRVRVESGEKLGRGDQAVIVGYDDDTQEFTVAPLPDIDAR